MTATSSTEPRRQPYKFEARIGLALLKLELGLEAELDQALVQFVVLQMKPPGSNKSAGYLMLKIRDEPMLVTRDDATERYKTARDRIESIQHRIDSLAGPDCERQLSGVEINRLIAAAKLKPHSYTESMLLEPSSGASPPGFPLETTLDPDDVKTLLVAEDIAARGLIVRVYNGIVLQLASAVAARVASITAELKRVGFVEKKGDLFFMTDAARRWSEKNPGTSKLGDISLRRMIGTPVAEPAAKAAPLPPGLGLPSKTTSVAKPAVASSKPPAAKGTKPSGMKNPYPTAPATLLANVGFAILKYGWRADWNLFQKLAAILDYKSTHEVNELRTLLVSTYKLMTIDAEGTVSLTTACRDWLTSMKFEPNLTEAQLLTMLRPSTDRYHDLDTQLLTDIGVAFEACPDGLTDEQFSTVAMNRRDDLDQDAVLALRKTLGKRALIIMNGPLLSYTSKLSSWLVEIGHEPTITPAEIRQLLNIPEPTVDERIDDESAEVEAKGDEAPGDTPEAIVTPAPDTVTARPEPVAPVAPSTDEPAGRKATSDDANNASEPTPTSSSEAHESTGRKTQHRVEISDNHRQFLGAHHRAERLLGSNLPAQIGAEIGRRLGFSIPGNARQSCEWRGYIEKKESGRRGTYYWHVTGTGIEAAGKYIDNPTFTDDVLRAIIEWWSAKQEPASRKPRDPAKIRQPKGRAAKIVAATPVATASDRPSNERSPHARAATKPARDERPIAWVHYLYVIEIAHQELTRGLRADECTQLALKYADCKDVIATRNRRALMKAAGLLETRPCDNGVGKEWFVTEGGLELLKGTLTAPPFNKEDVLTFVRNIATQSQLVRPDPPAERVEAPTSGVVRAGIVAVARPEAIATTVAQPHRRRARRATYLFALQIASELLGEWIRSEWCTNLAIKFANCKDKGTAHDLHDKMRLSGLLLSRRRSQGTGHESSPTDSGRAMIKAHLPERSIGREEVLAFVREMMADAEVAPNDPPAERTAARNDDIERAEREVAEAEATLAYKKRVLAALRG